MPAFIQYRRGAEQRDIACTTLMTIGRTPPNDIVIPLPKVSRNHALIRMLKQDEYYLIDVGSTNGTFLNGKRVVTPTLLGDGDVIALEDCALTFCSGRVLEPCGDDEDSGLLTMTATSTSAGVEMEEITLLVCDVRNYTPISESLAPSELAALMGRWFKEATRAITECSGTIDKFIGDAILVRWPEGRDRQDAAPVVHALRAARALRDICAAVNLAAPKLPYPFRVGVGINSGRAVLGTIGGAGYREYTAIGDAVNTAFRFESESKRLGRDVVIGPDSYERLPARLWQDALQSVTVKGKSEPIRVWALTFDALDGLLSALA